MSRSISEPIPLSPTFGQELITTTEVLASKYPEVQQGIDLHAPFADFEGVMRPVIADLSGLTTEQMCRVSLSTHALFGHEINLDAIDGEIGRPIYRLSASGEYESGFGDDESKETFAGFSLQLAMDGTALFLGRSADFVEPK
ncbi:hypothetical protein HZB74_00895, partial [Candidatus Saccharibacteria bacterium]|nr:hypothetical protein [Candidatus Saccharibacteria bacterium]